MEHWHALTQWTLSHLESVLSCCYRTLSGVCSRECRWEWQRQVRIEALLAIVTGRWLFIPLRQYCGSMNTDSDILSLSTGQSGLPKTHHDLRPNTRHCECRTRSKVTVSMFSYMAREANMRTFTGYLNTPLKSGVQYLLERGISMERSVMTTLDICFLNDLSNLQPPSESLMPWLFPRAGMRFLPLLIDYIPMLMSLLR